MNLHQWLVESGTTDDQFALLVQGVTAHAVKKWRYRERRPRHGFLIRIEAVTEGLVSLRDWEGDTAAGAA